jgi:hypothetical protein
MSLPYPSKVPQYAERPSGAVADQGSILEVMLSHPLSKLFEGNCDRLPLPPLLLPAYALALALALPLALALALLLPPPPLLPLLLPLLPPPLLAS